MTEKVRQGLGLLVVAALAFLLSLPTRNAEPSGFTEMWNLLTMATALVCGVVGLVFLALGLLRQPQDD